MSNADPRPDRGQRGRRMGLIGAVAGGAAGQLAESAPATSDAGRSWHWQWGRSPLLDRRGGRGHCLDGSRSAHRHHLALGGRLRSSRLSDGSDRLLRARSGWLRDASRRPIACTILEAPCKLRSTAHSCQQYRGRIHSRTIGRRQTDRTSAASPPACLPTLMSPKRSSAGNRSDR